MSSSFLRALGLMSGTSVDGVDVALIETDGERLASFGPVLTVPYADDVTPPDPRGFRRRAAQRRRPPPPSGR